MTPEEKLFKKNEKRRVLLTGFNPPDAKHIKTYLYSKRIKNVDEIKDPEQAKVKLELLAYHFILIYLDAMGGKELLDHMIETNRFSKTLIFGFSKSSEVFKGAYAKMKIIGIFCDVPINIGKFEKELISAMLTVKFERNQIGKISEAMDHYTKGCRAWHNEKNEEAKEEFRLCLKADPTFLPGFIKMGETLIDMKDYPAARRVLQKALSLEKDNSTTLFLIGLIDIAEGGKDAPLDSFDKAIKADPDNVHLITDIGNALIDQNMIDEAIKYFEMAKTKSPEYVYIYNTIAISFSKAGRFNEAEEEYKKALALDDEDAGVHFNIGTMWKRRDDPKKAIEYFKKSLELDPELKEAREMIKLLARKG